MQLIRYFAIVLAGYVGCTTPAFATPQETRLFIVHLTVGSGWQKDVAPSEQAGFREHSANLARLRTEGKLVVGARYKDSHADKGMLVLRAANRTEVEAEFARDPMITSKHFVADIAEFSPFYEGFIERTRAAPGDSALSGLRWLVGCWEGRRGNTVTREHWMGEAAGLMMGMARTVREGKLASYEAIRIELDADGTTPIYVPKPSGQAEARFRLASSGENRVIFENPEHDFPQRIIYERKMDGSLLARIEGKRNGGERAIDFPMKRASCQ